MTNKKSRFAGIADIRSKLPTEPEPEPERPAGKTGRPPGKKSDPSYTQVTVYLRKDLHRTAQKLLFDDRRQFSDLVDELVGRWVENAQNHTDISKV